MADALNIAVRRNDVPLVKQLIERGADVNVVDVFGDTAVCCAAGDGFVECAQMLLEANADVNKARSGGWTPLHIASLHGRAECVKLLIEWKANVNARTRYDALPLHHAADGGHLACVEMLIQAGAELDECSNYGGTPLALAINLAHHDIAELLLDKGAKMSNVREDVEIPDWMKGIVTKRQNVRRSLTTFIAVLRKRFAISGGGTEYTRGRLPRDVVGVLGRWVWSTRFDNRWEWDKLCL